MDVQFPASSTKINPQSVISTPIKPILFFIFYANYSSGINTYFYQIVFKAH